VLGGDGIGAAFTAMANRHAGGVVVTDDAMLLKFRTHRGDRRAEAAPSAGNTDLVEAGGLIGYGVNVPAMSRRGAYFVDRILKGTTPGDLPVERAIKFGMVFNLKTAKALGTRVGQSGQNASEVVEFTGERRGSSVAEQLIRNQ
jgi:putative ABC transport system substrate-binding protein